MQHPRPGADLSEADIDRIMAEIDAEMWDGIDRAVLNLPHDEERSEAD